MIQINAAARLPPTASRSASALSVLCAPHGLLLVTSQPLHGASFGDSWCNPHVWLLPDRPWETVSGHWAVVSLGDETDYASGSMCGRFHLLAHCEVTGIGASCGAPRGMRGVETSDDVVGRASGRVGGVVEPLAARSAPKLQGPC
jgi:hypothetical protein